MSTKVYRYFTIFAVVPKIACLRWIRNRIALFKTQYKCYFVKIAGEKEQQIPSKISRLLSNDLEKMKIYNKHKSL